MRKVNYFTKIVSDFGICAIVTKKYRKYLKNIVNNFENNSKKVLQNDYNIVTI